MATVSRPAPSLPFVIALLLAVVFVLPGCGLLPERWRQAEPVAAAGPVQSFPGLAAARTADELDRTTDAQRAAALSEPAAGGVLLGVVRVSLGSPAEQGFWLKSSLVDAPRQGLVTAGGASVVVELRPGSGAAQLSLAAFRALGLSLTGLPEVTVTAN